MNVQISADWKALLQPEFDKPYFAALAAFLKREKAAGKLIYPPGPQIFAAFEATRVADLRVLILGQDPYHGPGQAHGLSFSVPTGVAIPPSLRNMYKELQSDLGCPAPAHGNLSAWAGQGVLLLNASLTVEAARPMSHSGIGWATFTDAVIHAVSAHSRPMVFMLWGGFARQKRNLIDTTRHLVIESAHPSPLSAHNGFLGSRPFSRANAWLSEQGRAEVEWCL